MDAFSAFNFRMWFLRHIRLKSEWIFCTKAHYSWYLLSFLRAILFLTVTCIIPSIMLLPVCNCSHCRNHLPQACHHPARRHIITTRTTQLHCQQNDTKHPNQSQPNKWWPGHVRLETVASKSYTVPAVHYSLEAYLQTVQKRANTWTEAFPTRGWRVTGNN